MIKPIFHYLAPIILICIIISCKSEKDVKEEWYRVKSTNAYYEYDGFLYEFPNSIYSDSAKLLGERSFFTESVSTNHPSGYKSYLDKFPSGTYSDSAIKLTKEWYSNIAKTIRNIKVVIEQNYVPYPNIKLPYYRKLKSLIEIVGLNLVDENYDAILRLSVNGKANEYSYLGEILEIGYIIQGTISLESLNGQSIKDEFQSSYFSSEINRSTTYQPSKVKTHLLTKVDSSDIYTGFRFAFDQQSPGQVNPGTPKNIKNINEALLLIFKDIYGLKFLEALVKFHYRNSLWTEWENKIFACRWMGELDDNKAVPILVGLLKEKYNRDIPLSAAIALGKLKDISSVVPLISVLAKEKSDYDAKIYLDALKNISGQDFGYNIVAWNAWSKKNK